MAKLQIILFVALVCIAYGSAKSVRKDDNGRRMAGHNRSSAVRRHADINMTNEIAKIFRSRQRMEMLMRLINTEPGKHNISRKAKPYGNESIDREETSSMLLSHLNGETEDANLRVRVVNHRPVTAPRHISDFIRQADEPKQLAIATTCFELQQTLLKMPSLRIKVTCTNTVPERSLAPANLATAHPQPDGISYRYAPAGRIYLNGHSRADGLTLSKRQSSQQPRTNTGGP